MQITQDISTHTLVALVATVLSVTTLLIIFLLYRTYKYKIGQSIRRLFEYAPRFPMPSYEHPSSAFHHRPYHFTTWSTKALERYVAGTSDWDTLPSVVISQSTELSSLPLAEQEEEISVACSLLLENQEGILVIPSLEPSVSCLSSPEFPLREPGIPIIIQSNSETSDEYRPHSPTNSDPPVPTYNDLKKEIMKLWSEKESQTVTASSLTSDAVQVAQGWRQSQPLSIGCNSKPPTPKPMPSIRSRPRSTISILFGSSQSGLNNTENTKPARLSRDSLESLSLHGWHSERTQLSSTMTPEQQEREYTSIWRSRSRFHQEPLPQTPPRQPPKLRGRPIWLHGNWPRSTTSDPTRSTTN
ncbi:hypothetical protein EV421DRAFT_1744234 [Armillaria borealis]|uniref:Uncharacterized protein n=1 Tax=Armillaria borealis TaxID=47425 RepID=A0AA39ME12_9AGAR|nr:hypothetical protein EV421DRAFT_1744234 [Armillaria borealis]